MTPKENLLAVLHHQEPEWIPWIPLIDSSVNIPSFMPSEVLSVEPAPLKCLKIGEYFARHFGADILVRNGGLVETTFTSVKTTTSKKENIIHTEYLTDAGILSSKVETAPYGESGVMTSRIKEHMFKGPQDFKPLECFFQNMAYKLNEDKFDGLVNQAGERGLICTDVPATPIMHLIISYMGLERFIYMLSDYTVETEELMEVMNEKNLEWYRLIAASSAQAVLVSSDASTLLISPQLYKKYALPLLQRYAEICHNGGKVILYHSCGHIKDLLSLIGQSGIDAHEYLTPPPVGNTTFLEAKRVWGDKITIMGAIDPVIMEKGEPAAVKEYAMRLLMDMAPGKNFILESSSKPQVPRKNIEAIADLNKLRKYPLT